MLRFRKEGLTSCLGHGNLKEYRVAVLGGDYAFVNVKDV